MEISSIFDKLEALLPIFIFVIWAVISAVGAAGKSKRKPPQNQPQQRPSPASVPSHTSGERESGGVSTNISDELSRTLDVIFGNSPANTGHGQTQSEQVRESHTTGLNEKRAAQKVSEENSAKKRAPAAETAVSQKQPAYINSKVKGRPVEHTAALTNFSADEAVKGIIWSEILQPPVSMRG
jgi:hypothetical protein